MFESVIEVLELIMEDGVSTDQKVKARMLLDALQSFEFIFTMHMMKNVLGITQDLSLALQRKDQDIENAMRLVSISKERLQSMRDDGWDSLLNEVSSTNLVHFRCGLFYVVLDKQLVELKNRFSESNTELLLCVECLNPRDSFHAFNKESLIRLDQLYPKDFSAYDVVVLDNQLENYIIDVRTSNEFSAVDGIADLAIKMVETIRHVAYPLVCMLITLTLTLSVATANVERAFSAMKIIKNRLRNQMEDDWLNACLVPYIERDILDKITNETIVQRFQTMSSRREQL